MSYIHFSIDTINPVNPENSIWHRPMAHNIGLLVQDLEEREIRTVQVVFLSKKRVFKEGVHSFKDIAPETQEIVGNHFHATFGTRIDPSCLVACKGYPSLLDEAGVADFLKNNAISTVILSGKFEATP